MREQLRKTIELLRRHVQKNLEVIHQNEKLVREILREPVTHERSERLSEKYNLNKEMLKENNDFIKLQLSIVRLLDKYKHRLNYEPSIDEQQLLEENRYEPGKIERPDIPSIEPPTTDDVRDQYMAKFSREDYLELTANEMVPFDKKHPYFEDNEFIDELFQKFIENENYEMCEKLKQYREK